MEAALRENRKLTVLIVISNLEYGGAQRQVVEMANKIDEARFRVEICSLSDYVPLATQLSRVMRQRLRIIHKRFKFDISVVPRLARLIRRLRVDAVHSFLFDADIACRVAGRLVERVAVIGSERNTNYALKKRQLIAYWLTRSCADAIIANSRAGAIFNSKKLGHPAGIYRIVRNGVDTQRFAPRDGKETRAKLGIEEDEFVVGMFASFKEQKNHPMLFKAARQLLNEISNVRFLLVGEMLYKGMHGSDIYKNRMDAMIDELGIRSKCLFLGNCDTVEYLYPACDVTVLPSLFEGTPNVALESMACGVPVIVTQVSDNSDIVVDGESGYVVEVNDVEGLADRIKTVFASKDKRLDMGRFARKWTERMFSTQVLARRMENAYSEIIDLKQNY